MQLSRRARKPRCQSTNPAFQGRATKKGGLGGGGLGGAWVTRGTRRLLAVGEKFLSATGSRLPDGATVLGDGLR